MNIKLTTNFLFLLALSGTLIAQSKISQTKPAAFRRKLPMWS